MARLLPSTKYVFRLAAKNEVGKRSVDTKMQNVSKTEHTVTFTAIVICNIAIQQYAELLLHYCNNPIYMFVYLSPYPNTTTITCVICFYHFMFVSSVQCLQFCTQLLHHERCGVASCPSSASYAGEVGCNVARFRMEHTLWVGQPRFVLLHPGDGGDWRGE